VKIFKTLIVWFVVCCSLLWVPWRIDGQLSINHYSRLMLNGQDIRISTYSILAEIPFRCSRSSVQRAGPSPAGPEGFITLNGDGLARRCLWWTPSLRPNPTEPLTVRATLDWQRWTGKSGTLRFVDRNFPERICRKEIVVVVMPPLASRAAMRFRRPERGLSRHPQIADTSAECRRSDDPVGADLLCTSGAGPVAGSSSDHRISRQTLGDSR
jgi:hypothetical protein